MSRKNNSTKSTKLVESAKPADKTGIYAALITLIGTIIVAIVSIINTRTQVLLPASLTEALLSTKTNSPTLATTAFVCGNGTIVPQIVATPQPIIPEPTLVLVMVDETTTQETLEVVILSLNESLQAGDRVIIIVGGEQEYDKATLADEKIESIAPLIPSPLPPPPSSPTPLIVETPFSVLAREMATRTAQAEFALATQTAVQYSCSVYESNLSYQNQFSQWQLESKKLVSASIAKLENLLTNYGEIKPTNGGVFESMGLISNISRIECLHGAYKKCIFVPITEMVDARMQQPPSDIQVNLYGFDVAGTIADCPLYNQECQNRADYWDNYFLINGTRSVQFVNLDNLGFLLENIIGR